MMRKLNEILQSKKKHKRAFVVLSLVLIKRAKFSSKKQRNALLDCAEEFLQKLNNSQEDYQKRVWERLCLCCGKKGHYIGDCKANTLLNLGKGRQD